MSSAEQQATNAALATLAATGNSYALGQLWETNRGLKVDRRPCKRRCGHRRAAGTRRSESGIQ